MLEQHDAVLGRQVRSIAGKDMGRVVNVVVDQSGQVRAAIIDFGGFLGVGNRQIAVDWNMTRSPSVSSHNLLNLSSSRGANDLRIPGQFVLFGQVTAPCRPALTRALRGSLAQEIVFVNGRIAQVIGVVARDHGSVPSAPRERPRALP